MPPLECLRVDVAPREALGGSMVQAPVATARVAMRASATAPRALRRIVWCGWPLLAALVVVPTVLAVPMTTHAALPPDVSVNPAAVAPSGAVGAIAADGTGTGDLVVRTQGAANDPALPTATWPTGTVLELLRLDAQQALAQLRGGPGLPGTARAEAAAPTASTPVVDRIEVAAIYGTAGRLTAVLYINGRRKEYRPGAPLPVGSATARGEYRLVRIADGCVWLAAGARQRSACYDAAALPSSAFGREPPVPTVEQPGNVALAQPLAAYAR